MEPPKSLGDNPRLSQWVFIEPETGIELRIGKVEMGQGLVSAVAHIAASELGVPVHRIRIVAADTEITPDEGFTAGSLSIEHCGRSVRWVCASARQLFAEAAARKTNVSAAEIHIEDGKFRTPCGLAFRYEDLVEDVDLDVDYAALPDPEFVPLSSDQQGRLDFSAKFGGAPFIHDLTLPGLHHGRVLKPPFPSARLVAFDSERVSRMDGVVSVVLDGSFIGIVALQEDQADAALRQLQANAEWSATGELPPYDASYAWLETVQPLAVKDIVKEEPPSDDSGIVEYIEQAYARPFLAHASLAPSCALASWEEGFLHVISHTQGVFPLRKELAKALGMPLDRIRVTHAVGAGCYGHNGADDVALDAVLLSRAARVPVRCRWSRADEMRASPFGAPMRIRLKAGLDGEGNVQSWEHDVYSPPHSVRPGSGAGEGANLASAWLLASPVQQPAIRLDGPISLGDRNAIPLYKLNGRRVCHHMLPPQPMRTSALRSLGAHGNIFAIESFVDELACHTGRDPLEWRLAHLEDARARAVLEAAAAAANWAPGEKGGEGRGRGIGFARYKNTSAYCAVIVEISLDEGVRLTSVHAAVDCGMVIDRDGVLNQVEGGIVQAASWALKEEVTWDANGLHATGWETYPILGFAECPNIQVTILDREEFQPLGVGECVAGPLAAAIANAVHHALGVRVRQLPLTFQRIAEAIDQQ